MSDPAAERIANSNLREVVVTDSVPIPQEKRGDKMKVISLAPLIAEAIVRIHRGQSVGALFTSEVQFTQEMLLWDVDGADRPTLDSNGRAREAGRG
jgi:ribose-phosphate pyrophosphokinase